MEAQEIQEGSRVDLTARRRTEYTSAIEDATHATNSRCNLLKRFSLSHRFSQLRRVKDSVPANRKL